MKSALFLTMFIGTCLCSSLSAHDNQNKLVSWLYQSLPGRLMRKPLVHPWFSKLCGNLADRSYSRRYIKSFVDKFNIDMSESKKSIDQFQHFNDFFTRELKDGARQIDAGSDVLVSPCDAYLAIYDSLSLDDAFLVKGVTFNLRTCLNDDSLAREYEGGTLLVFRLAPYHYHRIHAPIDGIPLPTQRLTGQYDSVDPVVFAAGIQPLTHNERQLIRFGIAPNAEMLIVPVGALCVGKIVLGYKPNTLCKKGDELGMFKFGGSTVIIVFKKGMLDVDKEWQQSGEMPIRMGQRIGQVLT